MWCNETQIHIEWNVQKNCQNLHTIPPWKSYTTSSAGAARGSHRTTVAPDAPARTADNTRPRTNAHNRETNDFWIQNSQLRIQCSITYKIIQLDFLYYFDKLRQCAWIRVRVLWGKWVQAGMRARRWYFHFLRDGTLRTVSILHYSTLGLCNVWTFWYASWWITDLNGIIIYKCCMKRRKSFNLANCYFMWKKSCGKVSCETDGASLKYRITNYTYCIVDITAVLIYSRL